MMNKPIKRKKLNNLIKFMERNLDDIVDNEMYLEYGENYSLKKKRKNDKRSIKN